MRGASSGPMAVGPVSPAAFLYSRKAQATALHEISCSTAARQAAGGLHAPPPPQGAPGRPCTPTFCPSPPPGRTREALHANLLPLPSPRAHPGGLACQPSAPPLLLPPAEHGGRQHRPAQGRQGEQPEGQEWQRLVAPYAQRQHDRHLCPDSFKTIRILQVCRARWGGRSRGGMRVFWEGPIIVTTGMHRDVCLSPASRVLSRAMFSLARLPPLPRDLSTRRCTL